VSGTNRTKIKNKMKLQEPKKLKTLDLYAGCGGFSLGFKNAGFQVSHMVEKDKWACETLRYNFPESVILESTVQDLDLETLKKNKFDVIIGGPPCQGFSVSASNRRKIGDPRNDEYITFLKVCFELNPTAIIMENVPEIIRFKNSSGVSVLSDIQRLVEDNGYTFNYSVVNASHYGVPQNRKRFFFVALKGKKGFRFPPSIYKSNADLFSEPCLAVEDAISDLPEVAPKEYPEGTILEYSLKPKTDYQRSMRKNSERLHNHISMQHTPKTIKKFQLLRENIGEKTYDQNHRVIVKDKPGPTITASFYSSFIHYSQNRNLTVREAARIQSFPDSFIFSGKKTTLSKSLLAKKGIVSELHLDQFNQVGNAVPPILAKLFAETIYEYI
jgi:DNA (cytosine-5)-methyltransferase 1